MNKVVQISTAAAGGVVLFAVAFLGFARLNGAPMHKLPVFGGLFHAPEGDESEADAGHAVGDEHTSSDAAHGDDHAQDPGAKSSSSPDESGHGPAPVGDPQEHVSVTQPKDTRSKSAQNKASLLDNFKLDSPYTGDEIEALVTTLRAKIAEAEERLAEVERRDRLADDRLLAIEEREKMLDEMKKKLETWQTELDLRAREVDAGLAAKVAQDEKSVKALGALFAEGEADALAARLIGYGPAEGARILVNLEPDRARELLDALPQAKWREFAEAYTRQAAERKSSR